MAGASAAPAPGWQAGVVVVCTFVLLFAGAPAALASNPQPDPAPQTNGGSGPSPDPAPGASSQQGSTGSSFTQQSSAAAEPPRIGSVTPSAATSASAEVPQASVSGIALVGSDSTASAGSTAKSPQPKPVPIPIKRQPRLRTYHAHPLGLPSISLLMRTVTVALARFSPLAAVASAGPSRNGLLLLGGAVALFVLAAGSASLMRMLMRMGADA